MICCCWRFCLALRAATISLRAGHQSHALAFGHHHLFDYGTAFFVGSTYGSEFMAIVPERVESTWQVT